MARGVFLRLTLAAALVAAPVALAVRLTPRGGPVDLSFVSGPEPETLDPALATAVLEVRLLSLLFEGLLRIDPATLQPVPAACERFASTPDARGFTFLLREGLTFSDGAPLDADAFIASWRRAADPRTGAPLRREAAQVAAHARARDARTIEIALPEPLPELPSLLTLPCFLPVPLHAIERAGTRWTRAGTLVSNGPFTLEEWRVGHRLRFARNARYHHPARLERIEAVTVPGAGLGADTAFRLYETGGADLVFSVPAGAHDALRDRADLHAGAALQTIFLRLCTRKPPLDDPAVRRAIAQAIDRDALARKVLRGGEAPTERLVPGSLLRGRFGLTYEPEAARAELARASAGPAALARPLELIYSATEETSAHAAEVIQAELLTNLGLEVRLRPMERKAYYAAMRKLDYDIAWSSWVADFPDPANFLDIFRGGSGNNRTGFEDPGYDALLDAARDAGRGEARRARLREAEARLLDAAPLVPLYHPLSAVLVKPWVSGFTPNALNLVDWAALGRAPSATAP